MINYSLENLTDEQVLAFLNSTNTAFLLDFFRKNNKNRSYAPYIGMMGRLDRVTPVNRKMLPAVVLKLYKKNDLQITNLIQSELREQMEIFEAGFSEFLGREVEQEDLQNITFEKVEKMVRQFTEDGDQTGNEFDLDLFALQMELCGAPLDPTVFAACSLAFAPEEPEVEEVKKEKPKKSSKKKTAQESVDADAQETAEVSEEAEEIMEADSSAEENASQEETEEVTAENPDSEETADDAAAEKKAAEESAEETSQENVEEEAAAEEKAGTAEAEAESGNLKEEAPQEENAVNPAEGTAAPEQAAEQQETAEEVSAEQKKAAEEIAELLMEDEDDGGMDIGEFRYYPYSQNKYFSYTCLGEKDTHFYVGMTDIRRTPGGVFYNFCLVGELQGAEYVVLNKAEMESVLPDSEHKAVSLNYAIGDNNHVKYMEDHFYEGSPMLFAFTSKELPPNIHPTTGLRNSIGYRVDCRDQIDREKLCFPSDKGLYAIKPRDVLQDDIFTKKLVKVNYEGIYAGEKILISFRDGFCAGPYEVRYHSGQDYYYIQPMVVENRSVISGFRQEDCIRMEICVDFELSRELPFRNFNSVYLYYIRKDAVPVCRDVISDEALLQALSDDNAPMDGSVESITQSYENSVLASQRVPEVIRKARVRRLYSMFASQDKLGEIMEKSSNVIAAALKKGLGQPAVNELIGSFLKNNPSILDNATPIRSMEERMESVKMELERLEEEKSKVTREVQNLKESSSAKKIEELAAKKNKELQRTLSELQLVQGAKDLNDRVKALQEEEAKLDAHHSRLQEETSRMESAFEEMLARCSQKMMDLTFDGFMSSRLLQSAAQWEQQEEAQVFSRTVEKVAEIPVKTWSREQLTDYLVSMVRIMRPEYDRNTVLNLFICCMQSMLTVFSGAPGCGKTSICNIIGEVLGLSAIDRKIENDGASGARNRYIPVSVERGWTSKRDLVGYYNPLTRSFEENNRKVFDGLKALNMEAAKGISPFPFVILLDEANLSPMEYYWADFMNVCDRDERTEGHTINLGNEYIFNVPDTLHFVATINNDHTTETLSPRVVDRAFVVTLPRIKRVTHGGDIPEEKIEIIPWEALNATFRVPEKVDPVLPGDVQKIYEDVKKHLALEEISVSHRTDLAIRKYVHVAKDLMVKDEEVNNPPTITAMDFAIAQKILPSIVGSGEEYCEWLEKFRNLCTDNNLLRSAQILEDIIRIGNRQMRFYRFFR